MTDDTRWEAWAARIDELDAGSFLVTDHEADFLESLLERQPQWLSPRQILWLTDMCRKYGVSE